MRRKRRYGIGDLREYAVQAAHGRTGARVRCGTVPVLISSQSKARGGTGVRRKRRYIIGDLREYAARAARWRADSVRHGTGSPIAAKRGGGTGVRRKRTA